MSWTATGGGKRSNGDGTGEQSDRTSLPLLGVSRSAGGRGGRSCLQARGTGSIAVKAARRLLAVKTSQVFRGYQLFSRASLKVNARGSFPTAFSVARLHESRVHECDRENCVKRYDSIYILAYKL
ncbi:hypothetical protein ALC62_12868 [Cyphomyrmex costatus]|uniref:Uncharacterized protein n=1 Tax=Cyphomyrmex costatus TaxID=456900 RepID=A0A195C8K0_9HYME|nr:hypothetical protein ALC62_12868 [Cyphomyrmex costatus]